MSHILRARVSASTAAELADLCTQWNLRTSTAVRLAVRYLLDHPEVLAALMPQPVPVIDPRTPEQRESSDAYIAAMEQMDIGALVREMLE